MAYVDKQPLSHRLANLGTAGLIELGIGVALVAGLSFSVAPPGRLPPIVATNIPLDPIAPTPPPPSDPIDTEITVLDPPFTFDPIPDPRPTSIVIDTPLTPTVPRGEDSPTPQPSARPSPRYTPVGVAPRNDPSEWVTTDDYPRRELIARHEGTTQFRVIVGSNGRVQSCEVTRSSGHPGLDDAVCAKVERRARFNPATDESGAKVVGSYVSSVKWQMPR